MEILMRFPRVLPYLLQSRAMKKHEFELWGEAPPTGTLNLSDNKRKTLERTVVGGTDISEKEN